MYSSWYLRSMSVLGRHFLKMSLWSTSSAATFFYKKIDNWYGLLKTRLILNSKYLRLEFIHQILCAVNSRITFSVISKPSVLPGWARRMAASSARKPPARRLGAKSPPRLQAVWRRWDTLISFSYHSWNHPWCKSGHFRYSILLFCTSQPPATCTV